MNASLARLQLYTGFEGVILITKIALWCQWIDMLGLGSRLSTYSHKNGPINGGVVSIPLPIKVISLESPG